MRPIDKGRFCALNMDQLEIARERGCRSGGQPLSSRRSAPERAESSSGTSRRARLTPSEDPLVPLHFTRDEYAQRRAAAISAMGKAGLDGLLMFRQESMYYLTGYDTFGYVFFQCLYLGADGRLMLLTRAPDRLQAQHTSVLEDIRIWVDGPDAKPAEALRNTLVELGCRGKTLGVEWEAYGLTARNGQRLSAALDGFCTLADASELVNRLRVVKSPAEL